MVGAEPEIAVVVEGDAAHLFGGHAVGDAVVAEIPDAVAVLAGGAAQSAAVGAHPHGSVGGTGQTDDVVAHQAFFHLCRLLQGLDGDAVVVDRHDEYAVGGACPHRAVAGQGNGAHLLVGP